MEREMEVIDCDGVSDTSDKWKIDQKADVNES